MSIDVKGLNVKVGSDSGAQGVQASDLLWGDIEEGMYPAEMVIVYPWKDITKDTRVRVKDDDGHYKKDGEGKYVTEEAKDVTWYNTDVVFKIIDGMYDGFAVKGSLSTHPNMIGSAKRFLYAAKLFDVELGDLSKHVGTKVNVYVKTKHEKYIDKNTGLEVEKHSPYVSYYERLEETTKEE